MLLCQTKTSYYTWAYISWLMVIVRLQCWYCLQGQGAFGSICSFCQIVLFCPSVRSVAWFCCLFHQHGNCLFLCICGEKILVSFSSEMTIYPALSLRVFQFKIVRTLSYNDIVFFAIHSTKVVGSFELWLLSIFTYISMWQSFLPFHNQLLHLKSIYGWFVVKR